jgi:hypothetical protein
MFSIRCPHCQKELQVPNDRAGCRIRCSGCDAELEAPQPEPDTSSPEQAYTVKKIEERLDPPSDFQEHVEDLTRKSAKRRRRKPYHRKRYPVDLIAGLLLFACAFGIFLFVVLSEGGMMNTLINGILLPMIFIIAGTLCILSWRK